MVEEARLESSYTSKAYQGFESPSLHKRPVLKTVELRGSGGSNPSLSANDRKVGWVANECLQPFLFSGWTNLSGAV